MQRVAARWTLVSGTFHILCDAGKVCGWLITGFGCLSSSCRTVESGRQAGRVAVACPAGWPGGCTHPLQTHPSPAAAAAVWPPPLWHCGTTGRARHSVSPCFCCGGCEHGARGDCTSSGPLTCAVSTVGQGPQDCAQSRSVALCCCCL